MMEAAVTLNRDVGKKPACEALDVADEITENHAAVLASAFEKNPNRFKYKLPVPETLPKAVWINSPSTSNAGV